MCEQKTVVCIRYLMLKWRVNDATSKLVLAHSFRLGGVRHAARGRQLQRSGERAAGCPDCFPCARYHAPEITMHALIDNHSHHARYNHRATYQLAARPSLLTRPTPHRSQPPLPRGSAELADTQLLLQDMQQPYAQPMDRVRTGPEGAAKYDNVLFSYCNGQQWRP